jgi:hypothetical protein
MIEANITIDLDSPHVILSVDDSIEELLGFNKADFTENKVTIRERFHQSDQDIADEIFSADLGLEALAFNIRLRQKNGLIRCVKATTTKHKDT